MGKNMFWEREARKYNYVKYENKGKVIKFQGDNGNLNDGNPHTHPKKKRQKYR